MADYKLTIGLEVHAELNIKTKMFCNSANHPDEKRPNTNVCPVCMGYPGTLPVINKEAVRSILRLGVAVEGELADFAEFDRKNYFYPDIPKGFQISQYKNPLVKGGTLNGVQLTRIHLEEDPAKPPHLSPAPLLAQGEGEGGEVSLLDFNRAGVPLMELVTEPVMHTADEAMKFAKELQLLLQYLDISGANMELGQMRVEANISVAPLGHAVSKTSDFGTKVEVKNINSFRAVGKAIEFEYKRQTELLEKSEKVVQETRGWNEDTQETFSQRLKESAHDYRYFPEPDLPKLFINEVPDLARTVLAESLPELPWHKRQRLLKLGISAEHAEIYVTDMEKGSLFEATAALLGHAVSKLVVLASNYITTDLKKLVPAESLAEVIGMVDRGEISSRGAKDILKIIQVDGGNPKEIAREKNLIQESDREVLKKVVDEVLNENPEAPIQFLIGQAMKKSENKANPKILSELFEQVKN